MRAPRVIAALLSGAGLGVSGVMFGSATKSRLNDPSVMGISSSACVVNIAVAMFAPALVNFSALFAAFAALLVCALIFFLS